jgi:acyl-coenzyme A synthetase/AMP-(fatty) acid ligase
MRRVKKINIRSPHFTEGHTSILYYALINGAYKLYYLEQPLRKTQGNIFKNLCAYEDGVR